MKDSSLKKVLARIAPMTGTMTQNASTAVASAAIDIPADRPVLMGGPQRQQRSSGLRFQLGSQARIRYVFSQQF